MGTVRRGNAVAANAHSTGAKGAHNGEVGPLTDAVVVFFEVLMSAPSFNRHFKAATSTSPLQYQKIQKKQVENF